MSFCPNCWRERRRKLDAPGARERHLKRAYRVTPEWEHEQLAAQKNKCAICETRFTGARTQASGPVVGPIVDHDHKTGLVRGLLCHGCNAGIGLLNDDIERLQRAIVYLKKHAKTPADVEAHLAQFDGREEAPKRGPRVKEEKHDPNESIESIVARMGAHVGTPRLPSGDDDFIETTLADEDDS